MPRSGNPFISPNYYYHYYYYYYSSFSHQRQPIVSNLSLSKSKSGLFSVFWPISTMLDSHYLSSNFQILNSFYQTFGDCTKRTNYNWYNRLFNAPRLFQFPSKFQVLIPLFVFFKFHSVVSWDSNVYNAVSSLFLLIIKKFGSLTEIRWSVCMLKSQKSLCVSFSRTDSGVCIYEDH